MCVRVRVRVRVLNDFSDFKKIEEQSPLIRFAAETLYCYTLYINICIENLACSH